METESRREVAYVLDHFPVQSQTFVTDEIAELRRQGYGVFVVSLRHVAPIGGFGADFIAQDHPWRLLLSWIALLTRPVVAIRVLTMCSRLRGDVRFWSLFAPVIANELRSREITNVHAHFALRAAAVLRVMSVIAPFKRSITTHAVDIYRDNANLVRVSEGARVVTISQTNATYLLQRFGISSIVVRCGINVNNFAFSSARSPDVEHSIVSVGRLVPKKGMQYVLDVAGSLKREIPDLSVKIVGTGPCDTALLKDSKELGLENVLLGAMDRGAVLDEVGRSSVFMLACDFGDDGDVDGIPVVLMEAMALGVPVVTTNISGIPELVNETNGWIVQPRDTRAMSQAVRQIFDDDGLAHSRAVAAREWIEREFNLETQARLLAGLLWDSSYGVRE